MFELLHDKIGLTEAELMAKMTEIDMRDSHMNGQVPITAPVVCEACGKTYSKRHNHCLYCGHVNSDGSPF
jgi:ribosomal protein L32